ncbi:hypothetical protein ACFYM7_30420 [Streptomyces cyaneofuscatus]|uniref:hypothetical protein n=1 Tax=Streptomyces cyaneofuscatus TaxID=66883 RepID=UPI003699CEEA
MTTVSFLAQPPAEPHIDRHGAHLQEAYVSPNSAAHLGADPPCAAVEGVDGGEAAGARACRAYNLLDGEGGDPEVLVDGDGLADAQSRHVLVEGGEVRSQCLLRQ